MRDAFLRPLLDRILRILKSALQTRIIASSIDLRPRTLSNVIVLREHRNIDILVVDEAHGLVVIIENKIRSDEHSDQLARYLKIVKAEYPHCRHIIGVFLTPEGRLPSEPNRKTYIALDYGQVYAVLREVINGGAAINADVSVMLRHYADLLRRHIVSESDIAEISQQIYARHKRAIDLIIEHLPARQASLRAEIEALVRAESEFQYEVTDNEFVYFTAKPWVDERLIQQSQKWATDKLLAFAFDYTGIDRYSLTLTVGPGDQVALSQERRAALLRMAEMDENVYNRSKTVASGQHRWTNIYYREFFEPDFLTQATLAQALEQLRASWALFLRDLPNLIAGIKLDALP